MTTLFVALDAGEAFIGALLHVPADEALRQLGTAGPDDLEDSELRAIAVAIRTVAQRLEAPEPGIVLAQLRDEQGASRAHRFGVRLATLYAAAPTPSTAWSFARILREETARREARKAAERLQQAADAPLESLLAVWEAVAAESQRQATRLVGVEPRAVTR